MTGYVQLKRCEETVELMKHPPCFLLLTQIALRAKRTDKRTLDGLEMGQAKIGDYKTIGLTEKQYRRAKQKLQDWNFAVFKGTPLGTIATITNTTVYDINEIGEGEQRANRGRTEGERGATNNNVNKERKKENSSSNEEQKKTVEKLQKEIDEKESQTSLFGKQQKEKKEKVPRQRKKSMQDRYLDEYEAFRERNGKPPMQNRYAGKELGALKRIRSYLEFLFNGKDDADEKGFGIFVKMLSPERWDGYEDFHKKFWTLTKMSGHMEEFLDEYKKVSEGKKKIGSMEQGRTSNMGQLLTDVDPYENAL